MGAGASATASNIEQNVTAQFDALLPQGAAALSLSQVLMLQPIAGAKVQLRYLPILFLMDGDLDGVFKREEVVAFFELCSSTLKDVGRGELDVHMQGRALLHLQRFLQTVGAIDTFCTWFVALFNDGLQLASQEMQAEFVSRDVAHGIHHVLHLESSNGYDAQGFLDLLQRMGEEEQIMDIGRNDLDDVVPVSVVKCFAKHYAASVCRNAGALNSAAIGHPT